MFRRVRAVVRGLLQPKHVTPQRALTGHFLRQFFQAGDAAPAETSMVRALAGVAAPMLITAFWIVTLAGPLRGWSAAGVHYLFVLYAFCGMGCVTTLQWERLFPERMDFLVLLPMPLRGRTIFAAKLRAVAVLLLLFLFAANVFGTLLLPVLAGRRLPVAMLAHAIAVFGAGAAAALAVLALESLVVAVVPERLFRYVAPVVQTVLVSLFLVLFLRMGIVTESLPVLLTGQSEVGRWFPPVWFLAVYEVCFGGAAATPYAHVLARQAGLCLPVLLVCAVALYPAAWARRQRMALEGSQSAQLRDGRVWAGLVHRTVLRTADGRAVFHFMRQTLARLSRYHVALAAYAGAGIALSLTAALRVEVRGDGLRVGLIHTGAQVVLPLLLFWMVAGLQTVFSLPADLGARWVFRLAGLQTQRVISTAKLFVFGGCCGLIAVVLLVLGACGWHGEELLLQAVYGLMCAVLLIDIFFYLEAHVPFTRPPLPGRSSLPMTLATYIFGVPVLILLMITLEHWAGHHAWRVLGAVGATAAVHGLMHWLRGLPSHPASADVFLDEFTEEIQTLGLSA